MVTTRIKVDGLDAWVIHNPAWGSGDVIVRWGSYDRSRVDGEVRMPGKLLLALSARAAKDDLVRKVIAFLEDL